MRPYFGENTKDGKFPHLLIQLNKALDVQVRSAEEVRAAISHGRRRDFLIKALLGSALLTNRSPFDRKLEVIRSWSPGPTGVVAAAVTPDGRCVVSGSDDNTL